MLADATEALVAAVYEERGLDGARALVAETNPESLSRSNGLRAHAIPRASSGASAGRGSARPDLPLVKSAASLMTPSSSSRSSSRVRGARRKGRRQAKGGARRRAKAALAEMCENPR